jgi:bifunctional non-homologous end joining protein LigD
MRLRSRRFRKRLAQLGDLGRLDEAAGSLDQLLELAERDQRAGVPDAPWPPHFSGESSTS